MFARCVNGDSRTDDAYKRALEGRKAHLLHTDPPYCLLERRRKGGDLRDPKDRKIERGPLRRFEDVRSYRRFTEEWLPKAIAQLVPGAPLVVWTNFLGKEPIRAVARAHGYGHLAGEFVWAKRGTEKDGNEILLRVYEVALVLLREPLPALPIEAPARTWSVVAGYDDDGEAARWGSHPNHKPFGVLEPVLRTYTRPGDLVLDCFAGSGSLPAAALRLGRSAACVELEPEWARRVQERLALAAAGVGVPTV
ncbi:MAG: site-specific DNA-methyltransferase [Deltaproteobacteria bacterium]|nr:site-specific DNA-methyltransferase [Deltaproteobacteria bacterium]